MSQFDPDAAAAPGSGIFGLRSSPEEASVIVIPVPWEATTSYGSGTAAGPAAVLEASRQVDLFDVETGRPYQAGVAMLEEDESVRQWNREARTAALQVLAAGGSDGDPTLAEAAALVNVHSEQLNRWVRETTKAWLDRGKQVCLLGGDHSSPFGAIQAQAERHPGMGILHVDAHADLRHAFEGFTWSHASIMENVCRRIPGVGELVQVAVRDLGQGEHHFIAESGGRVTTFFDADLAERAFAGEPWAAQVTRILEALPDDVYVSFDVDGLEPALCPHTGTPVPGGLTFPQASFLLGMLARSGRRIVGFDLCEVAPAPSAGDSWDANVGARLLYKLIGWMLLSQGVRS